MVEVKTGQVYPIQDEEGKGCYTFSVWIGGYELKRANFMRTTTYNATIAMQQAANHLDEMINGK